MPTSYKLQRLKGRWAVSIYRGGKRISRHRLESRSAEGAAEEYTRFIAELKKPKDPTINQIWSLYINDRQGRVIAENMGWSGKAVLPHFGKIKPSELTVESCRSYVDKRRLAGRKDGTIWTELGHLRSALVWAKKSKIIEHAPNIERPSKPSPKDRHLTRDEFDKLYKAAEAHHIKLFLILAVSTAGRLSALLELTWDRVDFERGIIYLGDPDFKGRKKGRATVPMTESLRAELTEAKNGARTGFVIEWAGKKLGGIKRGISAAAKRAKIEGVSPHVLRHTSAVWMAEKGVPMSKIAQYLGHNDDRITQRVYARFSPTHLRDAADALEIRSA